MAKMRISPELKKLIEKYRCVKDTEGMSPAKVYKLVGENENLYLKMTDSRYKGTTYDVEREKDMMLWLEGKLPVPKVLHFERHDGWSNLLMSEADGVLCSEEYEDEQSPEKIIELYAECIRLFHSIDISDCPYTNSLPDYYEHIRQSKQEKLFHEAIFQIGNMSDCGCGTPDGERAAAALKDFAESFAERNPHLRVFNMVLHMDEATPHLHVDFIPVATEQSRGLSTRVSMKQALKQQGFVGVGRKQTEWAAWMEREKEALTEIAQRHDFEIISLGTNRPHMDLPQFKEAAARLEAVQQQTAAVEREVAELERQRDALKGTVRLLKEADRVNAPLHDIQPEKTLTGAVKGVTVDQVEQLKKMALRSVTDRHKVQELTEENTRLRSQVPSMKKRLEEAQRQQRLEQENRRLRDENYYLQSELQEERSFTERLTDGIGRMLDFLEEHLPERLRPLLEKARELLPDPEIGQQQEQQQHQRGMGGMEL